MDALGARRGSGDRGPVRLRVLDVNHGALRRFMMTPREFARRPSAFAAPGCGEKLSRYRDRIVIQ